MDKNLKSIQSEGDLSLYRAFLERDKGSFQPSQNQNVKSNFKSLNELIRSLIGKYVKVQFMNANGNVQRYGVIKSVGEDYFTIKNSSTHSDIICRTENILFINEVPAKFRSNQNRV